MTTTNIYFFLFGFHLMEICYFSCTTTTATQISISWKKEKELQIVPRKAFRIMNVKNMIMNEHGKPRRCFMGNVAHVRQRETKRMHAYQLTSPFPWPQKQSICVTKIWASENVHGKGWVALDRAGWLGWVPLINSEILAIMSQKLESFKQN